MQIPKKIVALDFETFTDGYGKRHRGKEYYYMGRSDQCPSTSEYIRDPRFKVHGAAVRLPGQRKSRWLKNEQLRDVLNQVDWSETALLCHNTAFDGAILNWHFGHIPAMYLDTLSMARPIYEYETNIGLDALGEFLGLGGKHGGDILLEADGIYPLPPDLDARMGAYGTRDADLLWKIYKTIVPRFQTSELVLIHLSIKAFVEPVIVINAKKAREELALEIAEKRRIVLEAGNAVGLTTYEETVDMLQSPAQLAAAFRSVGLDPPTKPSPTGSGRIYAFKKTDMAFQALQRHSDDRVKQLALARLAVKSNIGENRATRVVQRVGKPLPVLLNYCGAHTFRWSGGDKINPQNFPTRSGRVGLRHALEAPPGYVFCVVDSSQIEARGTAWLAGQWDLLEIFADPSADPYVDMASKIFGRRVQKEDKDERFVGKVAMLQLQYQSGGPKLKFQVESGAMGLQVPITSEQAETAKLEYRARYPKIVQLWNDLRDSIPLMVDAEEDVWYQFPADRKLPIIEFGKERIYMPNGLCLKYPNIHRDKGSWFYQPGRKPKKLFGGQLTENIVQCFCRIIVGLQMIEIAKKYRVVTMAHDEVVYLAPYKERRKALDFGVEVMSQKPDGADWVDGLPLAAEGIYAKQYLKP